MSMGRGAASGAATRALLHEHTRTVAEQADRHAVTLESILAILRSPRLDHRTARTRAVDVAAAALVSLRADSDAQRQSLLEPVTGAFERLQNDLRPLIRYGDLQVQFVAPPATGRALPGEVAQAARAIVRIAVLALTDREDAQRVRIQWNCDGLNLLIDIHDDGDGELDVHDDSLRPIAERVKALDGRLDIESTSGWGSHTSIRLPLDPPGGRNEREPAVGLTSRERDVLHLVAAGHRNADIAAELAISPNTVKFHIANLLRKVGARTRSELIALTR